MSTSFLALLIFTLAVHGAALPKPLLRVQDSKVDSYRYREPHYDHDVLILGGGVSGIIAARELHKRGVNDFLIIEGREQLGGRMVNHIMHGNSSVELGANWVQGTSNTITNASNPILDLAVKHGLKTNRSNLENITTFDSSGQRDWLDVYKKNAVNYQNLFVEAGARVFSSLVDMSARAGYSLMGIKPSTPEEKATEYYRFDFEYAQSPDQTSWIAAAWNQNHTFEPNQGGFSNESLLSVDQRGFKYIIQHEAEEFLKESQVRLNSIVRSIAYSNYGVTVTLKDGRKISARYAICTFSLGVLQNDDVVFEPKMPMWKQEAVHSMTMGLYTKIFMKFPRKFWFDTESALYADPERGRYPVWQSLDHPKFLPDSGILFATVTGDFSKRIEALSDEQVQSELIGVLRTMYPHEDIPQPLDFHFKRWRADPLFRGSYSNWPPSLYSEHHTNLRANLGRLWFAGEATSLTHFGFLHGAYFEGEKVGGEVATCVQGGGCPGLRYTESVYNAHPYQI
ncbi:polyamine oxidase [Moniliophthora roreri MCA 2997]|uniref:Amine oxidase n=1 Tax=Moniliophthora roreri (strain MCA 2997) TaxID=1381753 RepID=V2XSP5_MONRO|nr:polyamine oxidase [Moniliophthora roreri MCA 2997]